MRDNPFTRPYKIRKYPRSLSTMETSGIYINLKLYVLSGVFTSWHRDPASCPFRRHVKPGGCSAGH